MPRTGRGILVRERILPVCRREQDHSSLRNSLLLLQTFPRSPWTSVILSSPIQKYCHVPQGNKTQSSRDTTAVSGTVRSPAIPLLNRLVSSVVELIREWLRFTRTKTTCCRTNRIKSMCDPTIPAVSSTTPRSAALSHAFLHAFLGGRPRVMSSHLRGDHHRDGHPG